jgi:hypothetical protein
VDMPPFLLVYYIIVSGRYGIYEGSCRVGTELYRLTLETPGNFDEAAPVVENAERWIRELKGQVLLTKAQHERGKPLRTAIYFLMREDWNVLQLREHVSSRIECLSSEPF